MKTKLLAACIAAAFSTGAAAQISCAAASDGQWMPAWGSMAVWNAAGPSSTTGAFHGAQYLYWDNDQQLFYYKWAASNSKTLWDPVKGTHIGYAGEAIMDGTFELTTRFYNGVVPNFLFDRDPYTSWETTLPSPFLRVSREGHHRQVSIGTYYGSLLVPRRMYWAHYPMVAGPISPLIPGNNPVEQFATVGRRFPADSFKIEDVKTCTNITNYVQTIKPGWIVAPTECAKFWHRNWSNPNLPEGTLRTSILDQAPSRVLKARSTRNGLGGDPNDPRKRRLAPPNDAWFDPAAGDSLIPRPGGPNDWGYGFSYC